MAGPGEFLAGLQAEPVVRLQAGLGLPPRSGAFRARIRGRGGVRRVRGKYALAVRAGIGYR